MATVTQAALTSGSASSAASATTASVSNTTDRLLLLAVLQRISSGTPNQPTVTGLSLTWGLVRTQVFNSLYRLSVFRAMGSGATGTIAIDFGGQSQANILWGLSEFANVKTGADGANAVVQSGANTSSNTGTCTVTLSPFSNVENATYGAFAQDDTNAWTAGSGFTAIHDVDLSVASLLTQWKNTNDTGVEASFSSTNDDEAGIAIEIAAQAVPGISGVEPDSFREGETFVISGSNFEAAQGTGEVILSPTDNAADAGAVVQPVSAWSDTEITVSTADFGGMTPPSTAYVFVTNNSGDTNAAGFAVTIEETPEPPTLAAMLDVVVYDGATPLAGITGVIQASISEGLDRLGTATFAAAASAEGVGSATVGREVHIRREGEGVIFKGRITNRKLQIDSDGAAIVVFQCNSLGIELQWDNTYRSLLVLNETVETALNDVLTDTDWSGLVTGSAYLNLTKDFVNQTKIQAIDELASIANAYWRETHIDRQVEIKNEISASGMVLANVEGSGVQPSVGLIERFNGLEKEGTIWNRIVPEIKRDTEGFITLRNSTRNSPYVIDSFLSRKPRTVYHDRDNGNTQIGVLSGMDVIGENRLLVIWLALASGSAPVLYAGGHEMTLALSQNAPTGTSSLHLYVIENPPKGHIALTTNGVSTAVSLAVAAYALENAAPIGDTDVATGTGTSPSLSLSNDEGAIVLDAILAPSNAGGTYTPGAGQTNTGSIIISTGERLQDSIKDADADGSTTMSWTIPSQDYVHAAVVVPSARNWYIEDAASVAAYGVRVRPLPLGSFTAVDVDTVEEVANAAYDYAVDFLTKHKDPPTFYDFDVAYLPLGPRNWLCGDSIRVIYNDAIETIDEALVVVERTHSYDADGVRRWNLVLSDKAQFRRDENGLWLLEQTMSRLEAVQNSQV